VLIAFAGTVSTHDLLLMIAFQYVSKLLIEAVLGTPMAYAVIKAKGEEANGEICGHTYSHAT
jgi:uncharacterized PurR-regulated membrane protein YhhQ (DUF165 family)